MQKPFCTHNIFRMAASLGPWMGYGLRLFAEWALEREVVSRTKIEEKSLEIKIVIKRENKRKVSGKIWSLIKSVKIRRLKINWFWN